MMRMEHRAAESGQAGLGKLTTGSLVEAVL